MLRLTNKVLTVTLSKSKCTYNSNSVDKNIKHQYNKWNIIISRPSTVDAKRFLPLTEMFYRYPLDSSDGTAKIMVGLSIEMLTAIWYTAKKSGL